LPRSEQLLMLNVVRTVPLYLRFKYYDHCDQEDSLTESQYVIDNTQGYLS